MNRTLRNPRAAMAATLALAFLACASLAAPAGARTLVDLRAGAYTASDGGLAIGGGLIQRMGPRLDSWWFNPNLEAAFGSNSSVVSLNADFHYDFPTQTSYSIYAGAGPAVIFTNPEVGDSETSAGLNLVGGVSWQQPSFRPFAQLKGVISDQGQFAIMGGVRF